MRPQRNAANFYYCCSLRVVMRQVGRHLPKLFDSLAKLRFEDDDDDAEADSRQASETSVDSDVKDAVGMRSKDSEYVALSQPCNCSGQVI